jgi:CRP/FNR family cyclic AMP-dependent transcriptional regulator
VAAANDNPALEAFLRSIPLFSLMEPPDMLELLRLLRPVELVPGQVLFRQGEPGNAMWVLGSTAEVSISATPKGGKRPSVIAYARGGDTVGEMALIDDGARSGTAVVVQGGHAHQIDAVDFHALRQSHSPPVFKILRRLSMELCAKLRATSDRIVPPSGQAPAAPAPTAGKRASDADVDAFRPLAKLPRVVKLALAQKVTVIQLDGVQPLFAEGDVGDAAYFVTAGEVTVGRNGKTLATMGPGSMIGLVSVIDKGRRSASCLSQGTARLLRLSRADFEALFSAGNAFAFDLVDLVCRQLVSHLRATNELIPSPGSFEARLTPPQPMPAIREAELLHQAEILPLDLELELDDGEIMLAGPLLTESR